MQKVGPLKFSDLPKYYQDLFTSRRFDNVDGEYFDCKPPSSALFAALFFSFVYLVPSLLIIVSAIQMVFQKPKIVSRIVEDLLSSYGMLVVTLIIFIVVIWGLYFMLKMAFQSLARAEVWFQINRKNKSVGKKYGLIFDQQNLVFSHGEYFDDYTCAFLPKDSITKHNNCKVRVWFPKRSFDIKVVKVQYKNEENQEKELLIKERFSLSASKMNQLIHEWMKS